MTADASGGRYGEDAVPQNVERERKFVVSNDWVMEGSDWQLITQAYVFAEDGFAVRIRRARRLMEEELFDTRSTVAVKGPRQDDERTEYEYDIDPIIAQAIIDRSRHVIVKRRYQRISEGQTWEVDVFEGANAGLVIAELEGVQIRGVKAPWWSAAEVTRDLRYTNDYLALHPISSWV